MHSLESCLYALHNKKPLSKPKITGCYKALEFLFPKAAKIYRNYDKLSQPFLNRKSIDAVIEIDPSFRVFIQALKKIETEIFSA